MKSKNIPAIVIIPVFLAVLGSIALAAQDRFTLKAPNEVAFSEIRGYATRTWMEREPRAPTEAENPLTDRLSALYVGGSKSQRLTRTDPWGRSDNGGLCRFPP